MDLELRFFTEALAGAAAGEPIPDSPPARALVVDFDETLTTRDTTPAIIAAAVAAAADAADARGEDDESGAELREDRAALTAALVRLYSAERAALFESCFGGRDDDGADSPSSSFSADAAVSFTARLSSFDRAANGRAVEAGILAGAPNADAVLRDAGAAAAGAAAAEPLFRPGAVAALRAALDARIPVAILSVSWSTAFVVGALRATGLPAVAAADWPPRPLSSSSSPSSSIPVYANDLATDGAGTSTGALIPQCQCAEDKVELVTALFGGGGGGAGPAVYVGDAPSDLAALLAADVGIVVGESGALARAAAGVGAELVPLAAVPAAGRAGRPGVLYTTTAWDEVAAFAVRSSAGAVEEVEVDGPTPATTTTTHSNSHPHPPPRVLSIAGSDSGGGAGIQADLKTCAALGVFASTAITAVTVQNSGGVAGVHAVPPETVTAQIASVLGDIGADAVKTGMLPTPACVHAVADALGALPPAARPPLVVDPVLVSTSGDALAAGGVGAAMVSRLFPLATVVTPNLVEAAALLGRDVGELQGSVEAVEAAAADLAALGPRWVLVKGGHGSGGDGSAVVDVLHDGQTSTRLSAPRVDTPVSHGTGCTLAAALAAGLARGLGVPAAAAAAKAYVHGALAASAGLRLGAGPQWAMHHAYKTIDWSAYGAARPAGMAPSPENRPNLDLRVYAVTDPALDAAAGRTTADAAAAASAGGATIIQIRDKSGDPATLVSDATAAVAAVAGRAALLVNDRVDAALAAGADGAHVGQSDLPASGARAALGPARLLGVSVKTVAQALAAQAAGADYLGAGAIAGTATKADASIIGLDGLAAICRAVTIPVVAIGGVGPANAAACIRAGAAGVAVVSAIYGPGVDTVAATARLREIVDEALEKRGR
jgi:hydroxymethylpyrimidine kinase / phosphomethylpyrimidine kinase / thiamine-phosphate diphosphorylase